MDAEPVGLAFCGGSLLAEPQVQDVEGALMLHEGKASTSSGYQGTYRTIDEGQEFVNRARPARRWSGQGAYQVRAYSAEMRPGEAIPRRGGLYAEYRLTGG